MKEVSVLELKKMKDSGEEFQLIDVRENDEYETCNLGGLLIPMGEIMDHTDKIDKQKKVVIHCRSGKRSASVILVLESQLGLKNLYNLKGGIMAWAQEIDPSLPLY